jgi:hypothetical protein
MEEKTDFSARTAGTSPASLAAAWTLAGGIAGGLLVAALILDQRIHTDAALLLAGGLGLIGSVLGTVHGAILGHLARDRDIYTGQRFARAVLYMTVMVGAIGLAVMLSLWLALSAMLAVAGHAWGRLAFTGVLACSGTIVVWATYLGWRALDCAYLRWPDHRIGIRLVLGAFALLTLLALGLRPAIPGTELRLTAAASIVFAAVATLWIATPAVVMMLRMLHPGRPAEERRREIGAA